MNRPCCCGHCRVCREYEADLAACEQMCKARKAEPLEYSSQSCLGIGRPPRRIYTQSRGIGPGGEN